MNIKGPLRKFSSFRNLRQVLVPSAVGVLCFRLKAPILMTTHLCWLAALLPFPFQLCVCHGQIKNIIGLVNLYLIYSIYSSPVGQSSPIKLLHKPQLLISSLYMVLLEGSQFLFGQLEGNHVKQNMKICMQEILAAFLWRAMWGWHGTASFLCYLTKHASQNMLITFLFLCCYTITVWD